MKKKKKTAEKVEETEKGEDDALQVSEEYDENKR